MPVPATKCCVERSARWRVPGTTEQPSTDPRCAWTAGYFEDAGHEAPRPRARNRVRVCCQCLGLVCRPARQGEGLVLSQSDAGSWTGQCLSAHRCPSAIRPGTPSGQRPRKRHQEFHDGAHHSCVIGAAFAGWFRRGPGLRQVILRGLTASRADAIHCDLTDARATLVFAGHSLI